MKNTMARITALLIGIAVVGLTGCASPAARESMSAQNLTIAKHHPYAVSVNTTGGSETGALDSSNVSNEDLKAALETSIADSRLFKQVIQGKGGDYELNVAVVQLDKPMFGASFTVRLETAWTLTKVGDHSVAMRKAIVSSHTASMSDSLLGVTRLRLAVEGATRKNIEEGLQAIASLSL